LNLATFRPSVIWQKLAIALGATLASLLAGSFFPSSHVSSHAFPFLSFLKRETKVRDSYFPPVNALQFGRVSIARLDNFQQAIEQKQIQKEKRLIFDVPLSFKGTTIYDVELGSEQKYIALTFDDGPWPNYTEQVLDILKQNQVPGTFFWIGKHLKAFPEVAKKVVADGHAIANHTWSHHYHPVPREVAAREIEDTASLIYEITGVQTRIFRPPGGVLTNGLASYARSQNYLVAMWSSDAREASLPSLEQLINNVVNTARSGGIVLMHDGGGDRSVTVRALPTIIAALKQRQYQFLTLPELLELKERELQQPPETEPPAEVQTPKPDGIE